MLFYLKIKDNKVFLDLISLYIAALCLPLLPMKTFCRGCPSLRLYLLPACPPQLGSHPHHTIETILARVTNYLHGAKSKVISLF